MQNSNLKMQNGNLILIFKPWFIYKKCPWSNGQSIQYCWLFNLSLAKTCSNVNEIEKLQ